MGIEACVNDELLCAVVPGKLHGTGETIPCHLPDLRIHGTGEQLAEGGVQGGAGTAGKAPLQSGIRFRKGKVQLGRVAEFRDFKRKAELFGLLPGVAGDGGKKEAVLHRRSSSMPYFSLTRCNLESRGLLTRSMVRAAQAAWIRFTGTPAP